MALRLDPNTPLTEIGTPKAFIVHHTGGRGDAQGVINTLNQRKLGVQYIMDRDGTIYQVGGPGEHQMMTGWGDKGTGLSNANTVGMEVIARDDSDVTPAQVAAAQKFISGTYPGVPVYGHGEVNPGHKQATEGMTIVNAIRGGKTQAPTGKQDIAAAPSIYQAPNRPNVPDLSQTFTAAPVGGSGQAPEMPAAQFSSSKPIASVYQQPFQPVTIGQPNPRELLAQLMSGQGRGPYG